MIRKCVFLVFYFFIFFTASAQYYLSGQDPASVRWKQLKTPHFRLIFPDDNQLQAQYLANMLEICYPAVRADLNAKPTKSDLIFHTQSVISNATVAWAPRRLDFFHMPAQDGYGQEWFRQLSVHELRHVAQIKRLDEGFGKFLSTVLGQQGTAALLGIFIPNWFLEGDAVVAETAMSFSGRGRQPLFEAGLRAQLLEKGSYSYDKAYFGSYRHHVPDIYEFGYFMTAFNKEKYGSELWENVLDKTARRPFLLAPFTSALKEISGRGKKQLYRETMDSLCLIWALQDSVSIKTPAQIISPSKKIYTNYRFPQVLSDGSIVAIRSSMADVRRIVLIQDSLEKVLFTPGSIFNHSLSATDSLVVWNEFQPDIRWSNRNFSVIKIGDIGSGKIRQLTFGSNFFAPDISSCNRKIVVAETSPTGRHSIVVLGSDSSEELFRLSSDSLFFQTPKWMSDREHVVALAVGQKGKALIKVNTFSRKQEVLIPFGYTDFSLSAVNDNLVILHGAWSGISNIFAFNLETNELRQLGSSRFGAADADFDAKNEQLVYADYSADGWKIQALKTKDLLSVPLSDVLNNSFDLAEKLSAKEKFNIDAVAIPDSIFPVKKYRRINNLFHVHSWSPVYLEADNQNIGPGFSILSQNSLSTMVAELGYSYDLNEQTGKTVLNMTYLGLFPAINAGFSTGLRRGKTTFEGKTRDLKWWETDWNAGFRIPLNFTRDRWIRGMQPALSFRQIYREMAPEIGLNFNHNLVSSIGYDVFIYNQTRMSARDLLPAWGQSARLIFRHTPFDVEPSKQIFASASLFFPGLAPHHGLRLYGAWQNEVTGYYQFGSYASFPRGYNSLFFDELVSLKTDYVFPLLYPELNLPTVFYLKRIRSGLFFDYFSGSHSGQTNDYTSAGMELHSDWHFLNFPAPVNIGFRLSHTFSNGGWVPEFLFGVNFSALY